VFNLLSVLFWIKSARYQFLACRTNSCTDHLPGALATQQQNTLYCVEHTTARIRCGADRGAGRRSTQPCRAYRVRIVPWLAHQFAAVDPRLKRRGAVSPSWRTWRTHPRTGPLAPRGAARPRAGDQHTARVGFNDTQPALLCRLCRAGALPPA
jgi:hypothetical protein